MYRDIKFRFRAWTSDSSSPKPGWYIDNVIIHNDGSGDESWDSLSQTRQLVSSGVYIAHFEVTQDYFDSQTQDIIFKKGNQIIKKFVVIR